MNPVSLNFNSITGSTFRSSVVLLCVAVLAILALSMALVIRGIQRSVEVGLEGLGADIVVLPEGSDPPDESGLLAGKPVALWIPQSDLARVASIPGVQRASPQVCPGSLDGAS